MSSKLKDYLLYAAGLLAAGLLGIWYFYFDWTNSWDLPSELHWYHYFIGITTVLIGLVLVLYNLALIINLIYKICRLYIEAYRSRSE